ncbi:alpha/beta fold hydrolase [Zunongwangia pacifica]|uniref:Alpha/beta hydrolase n=1 Tax=Zunongwangia pacifica TaxID=2911062 RepID=A0A9X2CN55_9FLAO|nr:alpha/beta hydrolase [Zunongwangia pacifica]MCL6220230.1 alpha/beta hydrolase [Zunongwangia pacifica]
MAKKHKDKTPIQQLLLPWYILYTGKFLNWVSPYLASRFAGKLFLTPLKYKLPKREKAMDQNTKQTPLILPKSKKQIIVYEYGNGGKKVLLVHGWSGRGTQLSKIADALLKKGFSTISFDAPAHGKAPGKMSMMPHFIEAIHFLNKKYGPFHSIIGHSLGGMSTLKAIKEGVSPEKAVIIGTANSVTAITQEFVQNLHMDKEVAYLMKAHFDEKFGQDMDNYSGAISAQSVHLPTLVIHDKNDVDVDYKCAEEIDKQLTDSELYLTEGLGHRRILGDPKVINKITTFITA